MYPVRRGSPDPAESVDREVSGTSLWHGRETGHSVPLHIPSRVGTLPSFFSRLYLNSSP